MNIAGDNDGWVTTLCLDECIAGATQPKLVDTAVANAKASSVIPSSPLIRCLELIASEVAERLERGENPPWSGNEGDIYCCIDVDYDRASGRFEIRDHHTHGSILPTITRSDDVAR